MIVLDGAIIVIDFIETTDSIMQQLSQLNVLQSTNLLIKDVKPLLHISSLRAKLFYL